MANKRSPVKSSRTTAMKRGDGGTVIEQAVVQRKMKKNKSAKKGKC